MALIVAFILVPLIEIGLFVTLGGWLGLWLTLAWVVLSAVIGVTLLRRGGRAAAQVLAERRMLREGALAKGALAAMGAVLLVIPGFFTDAMGLILLLPPVQRAIAARLATRVVVAGAGWPPRRARADIIDGEWEPAEPASPPDRDRIGRH